MNDWGNIAVAVRLFGPWPEFVANWTWLIRSGLRPDDALILPSLRMPAHTAVNWIMERFLTEVELAGCDTLLLVDDDMTFTFDLLEQMRQRPPDEFAAVGALAAMRQSGFPILMRENGTHAGPYETQEYRIMDPSEWDDGDRVEVDAVGFGFTLFRRDVLQAIRTHPEWGMSPAEYGKHPRTSEDVIWSRKARRLGFRLAVDTAAVVGHLRPFPIDPMMSITATRGGRKPRLDISPLTDAVRKMNEREPFLQPREGGKL